MFTYMYLRCITYYMYVLVGTTCTTYTQVPHERQKELETWRSYICMNVLFKFTCTTVPVHCTIPTCTTCVKYLEFVIVVLQQHRRPATIGKILGSEERIFKKK